MINIFRKEPLLKKVTIKISLVFLLSVLILNIFHITQLDKLYKEQINLTENIVGQLALEYPNDEANIVKAIKYKDESIKEKGKNILEKYGYKEDSILSSNSKAIIYKSVVVFFLVSIISLILNINLLSKFFKEVIKTIENISYYIDNFIKNNYEVEDEFEQDGIFMSLISRIKDLGKKLNNQLYKLNDEKENLKSLVTDISHQLKTPLASISLYNSILLEDDISKEDRKNFVIQNEESTKKLHNLIDSLVNISRLESSMITIKPECKNIKKTIIKAINSIYIKAMDKNIEINLDEFEDININHDQKWTEEAIFNILDNGVKYTKNDGNIDIKISQTINYLRIDIKDNGIGINKEEINNLFKRFYRGKDTKYIEGSGVGLYLSRKIVEAQGGSIIASKNIDKGSTFSLLLQKCNN
ncbi:HAMP domain-containing sensor histidine kinase [Clostridium sp. CCUG 7971]|uniref:sensor histidine kinase n=1 Tax=Clostridium sp. CCUG 7971 TaxID=2811414 RepID=UPI001ABA76D4|nr:HAMP domain-containing histidine kinase [Clostridium sp. CCUG 7971]